MKLADNRIVLRLCNNTGTPLILKGNNEKEPELTTRLISNV
jgi:hypothetical protein